MLCIRLQVHDDHTHSIARRFPVCALEYVQTRLVLRKPGLRVGQPVLQACSAISLRPDGTFRHGYRNELTHVGSPLRVPAVRP